ncbi:MAG: response regulator, partial [Asticcacaulis sp.]
NMSHELRTPLNSLLILSDQLTKNPEGNLTPKQTDSAKTIHSSGTDLLMLINDILDLSKIESGTVVVESGELRLDDLNGYVKRTFNHMAESKNIDFHVGFDPRLPRSIFTDAKRLQQIIKNLLSNAFKFTHHGQVTLTVEPVINGWSSDNEDLNRAPEVLAFSVTDTGIGIAADKQMIIFEAFQQADGSTSRKYGGTGLGLAISRELARLLGGEIRLSSVPGRGSTFTLFLPATYAQRSRKLSEAMLRPEMPAAARLPQLPETDLAAITVEAASPLPQASIANEVGDDRAFIQPGDQVALIVENDLGFARFLLDVARAHGFKGLVTSLGASALAMTHDYAPACILLDIHLPDMQGWRVMERLKHDMATRHIPICIISTDESRDRALSSGALTFVTKPIQNHEVVDHLMTSLDDYINRRTRSILLVDPDAKRREEIVKTLKMDGVDIVSAASAAAAVKRLGKGAVDAVVLSGPVPEVVAELIRMGDRDDAIAGSTPVILHGDGAADPAEIKRLSEVHPVSVAQSPERLLDVLTLHLHRRVDSLPEQAQGKLVDLHQSNKLLVGKKVLIVDDDARNIFALTSVLEEHEMNIVSADNGREAINILMDDPDIDIVLMDIMMPEMDGMETIQEIRKVGRLKNLPIVAVTAKAMKGDREKCIEAGAWDYLSKPVDSEQMITVLRAWLHR